MPKVKVNPPKGAEARPADPLLAKPIVSWMFEDIGIDPFKSESNIRSYVDAISNIESSGGRNTTGVANKKTGNRALGNFQWFPAPFAEDLNAAKTYYDKADLPFPDYFDKALEHKDPRKLTDAQQDELYLIRTYRLGANADIAKMASGDTQAMRDFYEVYHHTNVDDATRNQMNKYLPLQDSDVFNISDIQFSDSALETVKRLRPAESDFNISDIQFSDDGQQVLQKSVDRRNQKLRGLAIEFGEGVTFGLLGELKAGLEAATTDVSYRDAKLRYEVARDMFIEKNPDLAGTATALEFFGALPTGVGLGVQLGKRGVTLAKAGAFEGAVYGAASGDTFEERTVNATVGGLAGLTLGKVIDMAVTRKSSGGLKTQEDEVAEELSDIDEQAMLRSIQEAEDRVVYTEVDNPNYARKPLSEAQTVGELWEGLKTSLGRFYNDKMTGTSDRLGREVSLDVMGRYQSADEAATMAFGRELDDLSFRLVPVLKIINESDRMLGILLDFSANKLGKNFDDNLARLEKEFAQDLNSEHMAALKQYIAYSRGKNKELNLTLFGADFGDDAFLHTINRGFRDRLKEQGKYTDDEIEELLDDTAFELRSRGSYLDENDPKRPNPSDYENPIASDMRRLMQLERLRQVQRKFNVRIGDYKSGPRRQQALERSSVAVQRTGEMATDPILLTTNLKRAAETPLTPDEFMEAFKNTLIKKGISEEGAEFTKAEIKNAILGAAKQPHPLIQAANSLAYALTLAGPLSAVLNLADIPLVGAKYGGRAALEALQVTNPFNKIPNPDLKRMGLNNQTFGEWVNIINDQVGDSSNWMVQTADKMRRSADFLMKGSLFAAMDRVGKKGVMRGVLKSAIDDVEAGRLADNWSFYFNQAELNIISSQLKKHGMSWNKYNKVGNALIEELVTAGLGQQQLISSAGRPSAWARHPNLRPLWALRGFVVKQQALALREVVGNLKAGKPEEAAKFLGRYAMYGAGGYAVINEGRQFIFGDGEVSAGGLARGYGDAWASLLTANTLGLNDYQFGKIKENGLMMTFAQGVPSIAVTRPFDIAETAIGVIDGEYPAARLASEVPLVRDVGRFSRNIGERFDIDPLEDFGGMMTQKRLPQD